ncbi:MAG: hypothetical protein KDC45_08150 [Bacteroidetes bacterium]|nr:hypothetical protein [Bacteroidota bacterium]
MKWICLLLFTLCSCAQPKVPNAYKIVVPDSLRTVKAELQEAWQRWNSYSPLPFTFSDSGSHTIYINDSAAYSNALFTANDDSLCVRGECVETKESLLAVRQGSDIRFITNRRGRMWFLVGSINELVNHDTSADKAVLLIANRRTALESYHTGNKWIDVVNVFGTLRDYRQAEETEEHYFRFHGLPMVYDPVVLMKALTPYGEEALAKYRPTLFTYPDFETKVLVTGDVMEFHYDEAHNAIHLVDNKQTTGRFAEIVSVYFARQLYGKSFLAESYGLWQSGTFYGKTFEWWKAKRSLLNLVDKDELLEPPTNSLNPFLRHLLGLWFWETRAQEAGIIFGSPGKFISAFTPAIPPVSVPKSVSYPVARFKGICFAHTNGSESGYMSRQSAASLEAAKEIGVNAISLTPFAYSKTENSPDIGFILDGNWDETAGSLFKAAEDAHRLGFHVMLKPHIWLGNGKWCGEIEMKSVGDVGRWMKSYSEFITYQALIAELAGMNSVCIATELEKMAGYSDAWRRIIALVRVAYSGPLTYAANWSGEYKTIEFWDDLDFIGINHYFPLASDENASVETLQTKLDTIASGLGNFSAKWNKPIVFTEVGFTSSTAAFVNPHDEDFSKPASEDMQALGFRLIFKTYDKKPWFKGYFWWKWESAETRRRSSAKSFHFRGKKAEQVVKVYYQ